MLQRKLQLQVAAMDPTYLSIDDVPTAEKDAVVAEGERDALLASGKPADMVEKILAGEAKSIVKVVLLEQESIRMLLKKK